MSFGFGSNNNNNNNNTSSFGFGSSNTGGGGFGANNASTGGSLFGGNTATSGGFGGGGGGFGANANNSSPFGQSKPAFGAPATTSSGGGMFGSNTATTGGFGGGGGFGGTTNTGGGFSGNTSGGLFGQQQNKPATTGFGATSTSGSLFGGGNNTSGGFGASNTTASNPFSTNTASNTGFGATNTGGGGGGFTFGGASSNAAASNNTGTGSTPFAAISEKDGPSGQTSLYQSITMQPPYANKSFEELRTEDYAQGRKYGNSNGQAGSFGQSTGFGATSSAAQPSGGLFGGNTATSGNTGFGASTGGFGAANTSGGFGSNTNQTGQSGGIFGSSQPKPATGGLFGQQPSSGATTGGFGSTASGGTGGGLFGGGGGFGSNTNQSSTGGGLFGSNNQQQQQPKPAFGGFGSNTNTTGGGFGSTSNTGGGLFGAQNNANTGSSLFGGQNNQQQQPQNNLFGGSSTNTGGGLFGNNQPKPASGGLFGSNTNTNTCGGLFGGQNNQQQQQSNPFGASTNTGSSLFGGNQNKPAGTGLFGSSTSNTNTGGGMFGAQNNQGGSSLFGGNNNQNTGSSLFGGNQNRPAGNSLFGGNNNTNTGTGSSLFGGNQQNQQGNSGSSLFGGALSQSNQNQPNQNANSLFGGSFGQSQQATPQNQLHASLTGAPYGNEQLFSSLAAPSPPIGPLATPLSGARPAPRKTPSLLASARLNTPVYSPRASTVGRNNAFGFSYSTYGTPGSAYTSGSLTPGASSLLKPTGSLSSALTNRLNKSFSTSNLRGDTPSEGRSLLRRSAFSPDGTPGRFQSGSMRKLKIDRSLRTDLFGPAESRAVEAAKEADGQSLRKKVSFEYGGRRSSAAEPNAGNALVRTEDQEERESPALIRAGPSKQPEMQQTNGTLSSVPEDTEAPRPSSAPSTRMPSEKASKKNEVGDYWTKPAMRDLKNMSRQQLKSVGNFTVGREGVGRIEFGSVDLTNTALDDICGNIVQLNPRSATVYQDDADKPSMGKALNVPSTIYLESSWPRSHGGKKPVTAKSGKEYDKHIARLKRVGGTHFQSYNSDTGIWCFKVDHFTTYELDDDDDESEYPDDTEMQEDSSGLSDAPATPSGQQDVTLESMQTGSGEVDDTFQFMLDRRSQLSVPGGFDYDDANADEGMEEDQHMISGAITDMDDPFTSPGGAVQAPSPGAVERYHSSMIEDDEEAAREQQEEQEMPGSFIVEPKMPKSILKPSTGLAAFVSPEKLATETWEEQLQRTMSPKKRDRQALKDMQRSFLKATDGNVTESPFKKSMLGQSVLDESVLGQRGAKKAKTGGVTTGVNSKKSGHSEAFKYSSQVMDSLWGDDKAGKKAGAGTKGFEDPYPKKRRLSNQSKLRAGDHEWHQCMKPSFTNDDTLVYSVPGSASQVSGDLAPAMQPLVGEHKDVRFARFVAADGNNTGSILVQKDLTFIEEDSNGFPVTSAPYDILFASLAEAVDPRSAVATREQHIWQLCSILFDPLNIGCARFKEGVPDDKVPEFEQRIRMDTFAAFWSELVAPLVQEGLKSAHTAEEKALLYLTQNDIVAACEVLISARDFKLATLVSQLPGTETSRAMMKTQVTVWRDRNDWSEMSEPVRALYSVLAGEVCVVQGKNGAAEDRVAEFSIAETFGLKWQQSFAFRLFYGGFENITDAMAAYISDVDSGRESVQPSITLPSGLETRDTIMDLMRLAATDGELMFMFDPLAVSGSAFKSRLTWQLASLLHAKEIYTLPEERLDQITNDYAAELEAADKLVSSAWTLLHLRDDQARPRAIAGLLDRHGDQISTPGQGARDTFEALVDDTNIPAPMVWRAKALYAKAGLRDPALQTRWLLNAGLTDEAHDVLCTTLGPQAVIEQDYDVLSQVLQLFRTMPEGWQYGGQVYFDFVRMLRAREWNPEAVNKLRTGLAGMEFEMTKTLEKRVAVIEMGRVLEETVREHQGADQDSKMDLHGVAGDSASVGAGMLDRYQRAMGVVA
ncbi:hypothetical protein LTR37_012044 [Vermiconidia calcicola]|uniref:Uncharacterized protein n=1 Tax=Vermiconidia calcicola TaxID=1690605 RepID=A0ACC3N0V3_9PEZI|nr:hypothetical protein LTR37_012044 [Vermiconidia calcicola]